MDIIEIGNVTEGMILAKSIISDSNNQIVLAEGVKLKLGTINALKNRGIRNIYVKDLFTIDYNPLDRISSEIKGIYIKNILKFAPNLKSAALSDSIVEASSYIIGLSSQIYENEHYIKLCLEMKIESEELYLHAIKTSVISMLIAKLKELPDKDILTIGLAGLFHDVGMLEAKCLISHRRNTGQEEALWRESPIYGYYIAKERSLPEEVAQIIKSSREYWNGTGIPRRIKGNDILIGSRILNVVLTYDEAIMYENKEPYEAIEYLYGAKGYYFDPDIVDLFINHISIYPLKSLVRLTNNEVGVVVNVRKNKGPRPVVNIYYNAFNKPLSKPKEVDLGIERTVFIKEILDY